MPQAQLLREQICRASLLGCPLLGFITRWPGLSCFSCPHLHVEFSLRAKLKKAWQTNLSWPGAFIHLVVRAVLRLLRKSPQQKLRLLSQGSLVSFTPSKTNLLSDCYEGLVIYCMTFSEKKQTEFICSGTETTATVQRTVTNFFMFKETQIAYHLLELTWKGK